MLVGAADGSTVGTCVGSWVFPGDGTALSAAVGSRDGAELGAALSFAVGICVGAILGAFVGASVVIVVVGDDVGAAMQRNTEQLSPDGHIALTFDPFKTALSLQYVPGTPQPLGAVRRWMTANVSSFQQWSAVHPPLGHSRNTTSESRIVPAAHIDESHFAPSSPPVPLLAVMDGFGVPSSRPSVVPHVGGVAQSSAFVCELWHAMQSVRSAVQHPAPLLSTPPLLTQCDAHIAIVGHASLTLASPHIEFDVESANDSGVYWTQLCVLAYIAQAGQLI